VRSVTVSPSRALISARATGEIQLMYWRAGSVSSRPTMRTVFSSPRPFTYTTVAPKKTWSVSSRVAGSTTSAASRRFVRVRMRRSISRRRFLPYW
jgi:hypothetical protein